MAYPYLLIRVPYVKDWDSVAVCKQVEEALWEGSVAVVVSVDKVVPKDGSIYASTTPQAAERIFGETT